MYGGPNTPPGSMLPPNIPMPPGPVRQAAGPSVRDRLLRALFPGQSALASLVSPEDIDNARSSGLMALSGALLEGGGPHVGEPSPSLGQSIGRGVMAGQDAFSKAIQGASQLQQFALQAQTAAEERAQKKQIEAQRVEIMKKYPPAPNETSAQTAARLQKMLPEFISDPEMFGKIVQLLQSQSGLLDKTRKVARIEDNVLGPDGRPYKVLYDEQGQEISRTPQYEKPTGKSDAQSAIEFNRQATRAERLTKGYESKIEKRLEAAQSIGQALASVPLAMAGDGAAQVDMLYAFIKAMDPTSVVREGEIALAREATPLWDWARANVEKIKNKSAVLPEGMARRMEVILRRRLAGYAKYIDQQRALSIKKAGMMRIDQVTDDPSELFLDAETLIGVGPLGGSKPGEDLGNEPTTGHSAQYQRKTLPDLRSLRGRP